MNWQQLLQLLGTTAQVGSQFMPQQPSTSTGGFNLGGLLNQIGSIFSPQAGSTMGQIGSIAQPLIGAGLIGSGLAQKEEPGYAVEARQYLRNRLSPTGIADQFSGQIGALNQEYLPLLQQQRNQLLDQTQQRFLAGQPSSFSTAMSGPEISRIRDAITNQILPAERAHLADIGQYLLSTGGSAAGTLLDYAKPDPLGSALASLGYDMLGGRQGPQGTQGTQGGVGQSLLNTFGGNTSFGDALSQAVSMANTGGNTGPLMALLSTGALRGTPFPIGLQASTPAGQAVQQAINAGLVESPAAQAIGGTGAAAGGFQGLLGLPSLSSTAGIVSGAASALGGGALGSLVGMKLSDLFESHNVGGTSSFGTGAIGGARGAAAGAAAGARIGDGPGAIIGAIVGGLGGGWFGASAERRREDAQMAYETEQTNQLRPEALSGLQSTFQQGQNVVPQLRSTASQLDVAIQQLSQSGDAQLQSLLTEFVNAMKDTGAAPHMDYSHVLDNIATAVQGQTSDLMNSSGGQSIADLLQSNELGLFSGGTSALQSRITKINQLLAIASRIESYVRSRLG